MKIKGLAELEVHCFVKFQKKQQIKDLGEFWCVRKGGKMYRR